MNSVYEGGDVVFVLCKVIVIATLYVVIGVCQRVVMRVRVDVLWSVVVPLSFG